MNSDDKLNEILEAADNSDLSSDDKSQAIPNRLPYIDETHQYSGEQLFGNLSQWSSADDTIFRATSATRQQLTPGVYEICEDNLGTYFENIPVKSDNLIRFPDSQSELVVHEIMRFWKKEEYYKHYGLSYKRGILLWGPPGCHAKSTKIIMSDGLTKNIEDIYVGETVMGPDSKPRLVLELKRGQDEMYKITPTKGESFVVNGHHIFNFKRTGVCDNRQYPETVNICLNDFLKLSPASRIRLKLHKAPLDFEKGDTLPLDPHIRTVDALGAGDYYGFTLSGDHLYLTDDFIVHHNSGKTSIIQIISRDVVVRDGIVIKFNSPRLFIDGMRQLREIQPETPLVVLMEDIDSTLEEYSETSVLNILDGINNVHKTVFLATTNYPEKLGARIVNRPSRFDKRFEIDFLNSESRRVYFKHMFDNESNHGVDLDQWVEDTEKLSIAHLKELFIAVVINEEPYDRAIATIKSMKGELRGGGRIGFKS